MTQLPEPQEAAARRVWDRLEATLGFNEGVAEGRRQLAAGRRVEFEPDRADLELTVPEPEQDTGYRRTGCLWAFVAGLAFWAVLGAVFVWWWRT